jgi:hypothetical protein
MHDRQWLRVGLTLVLVGAGFGGLTTAGCSGDDNGPAATGGKDASPDNTSSQDSGGGMPDTGGGGDAVGEAAAPPGHAHVYVVHASEAAPALRFCFGFATQGDGGTVTVLSTFTALPDTLQTAQQPYPGMFPGTGGLLDDHGFDLSKLNVAAYAIDATKLTGDIGGDGSTERHCDALVGSDGLGTGGAGGGQLTLGTDYWALGIIPAQTLMPGSSWVFAITGCQAGVMDATEQAFCGPAYDPAKGNLGFVPFTLDSSTVPTAGTMGAQFAHASYQWDLVKGQLDAGSLITAAAFYEPAPAPDAGPPGDDGGGDAATEAGGDDSGGSGDSAAEAGGDSGGAADSASGDDATTADAGDDGSVTDAGDDGGDAGHKGIMAPSVTQIPVAIGVNFGSLSPMMTKSVGGLTFDGTSGFAVSYVSGITPFGQPVALPLPVIQQLTYGTMTPPPGGVAFANGQSFVFVLVGNPLLPTFIDPADGGPSTQGMGVFNGRSAHFLAFPTLNH